MGDSERGGGLVYGDEGGRKHCDRVRGDDVGIGDEGRGGGSLGVMAEVWEMSSASSTPV